MTLPLFFPFPPTGLVGCDLDTHIRRENNNAKWNKKNV